ncbi:hypothetical protein PENSPDRAFT_655162 [Peniophora sp. CONT]|nr:hypothetical protein PENSPDRAFT_655162 [Peniophora sp. CONT]
MAGLLHLNDDCLHLLCDAASLVHPPHWKFTVSNDHDWTPLSTHDNRYDPSEQRFCLGWVLLSHVCRRLRRICLDSPALWAGAILALPSVNAWNTSLERARDSVLELCIPTNHCSLKESKYLEGQYMEKIWFAQDALSTVKVTLSYKLWPYINTASFCQHHV